MATRMKVTSSVIEQFVNVTGASEEIARSMLEACNGNLEMAIEMHLDSSEVPESGVSGASSSATRLNFAAGSSSNSHQ